MVQSSTEQASTVSSQDGFVSTQELALEQLRRRIIRLESDLGECQEYFADRMDVTDGFNGEPVPNLEMRLHSMIDEALHGAGR